MDFDFLDSQFLQGVQEALRQFQKCLEDAEPPPDELERLSERIRSYGHCDKLEQDFVIGAVDGSGQFPILQQDDIFVYLVTSAAVLYRTQTHSQHKLSRILVNKDFLKRFVVIPGKPEAMRDEYAGYIECLTGKTLKDIVSESDYMEAYIRSAKSPPRTAISWDLLVLPHASQISSHQYQLRSIAEVGMALPLLEAKPKYVLIDTSFVYFLLGKTPFLPEIMKRYVKSKALDQGTGLVALSKSHNVPSGDLIARKARDLGLMDHWCLRLPSAELGEEIPKFLQGREIPPKLCVSYLFKFHETTFPMRIDMDARWWRQAIDGDEERENNFFRELDYCCHEVRCYGYPYPMYAAHRRASLTNRERMAIRDILIKAAMREGLIRDPFEMSPEDLHMGGL